MKEKKVISGKRIVDGKASGEAIVSDAALCFRSQFDPTTGKVIDSQHPLYERSLAQKVLVMPSTTGSSGNTMHIRVAALEKQAPAAGAGALPHYPAALINLEPDSPSVLGCVIAEIPFIQVGSEDLKSIQDGDWVEVDASNESITVYEK